MDVSCACAVRGNNSLKLNVSKSVHLNIKSSLTMTFNLTYYIEKCLRVAQVVLIGELTWRSFLILHEYIVYRNYYVGDNYNKWKCIVQRTLSINHKTACTLLSVFCATCATYAVTRRIPLPQLNDILLYVILYWLCRYISIDYSDLKYAQWIRHDDNNLDYATGMASNYFFGYLKLTLPSEHDYGTGIRERIKLYEDQEGVKFALNRLIILIPSEMYTDGKIESSILSRDGVKPLETVIKNRAGVARPFKNDVYRFTIPINDTYYYVALEGATPLLSFYESMKYGSSQKRLMHDMKKEIMLKFYRHLKYLVNEWPETQNEVELVLYNSLRADRSRQDVGEVVLAHLTNIKNKKNL